MLHLRTDYQSIQPANGATSIAEDEPVFIVRAKDKVAPMVTRLWAAYALQAGADPETCARVQEWADYMHEYAVEHFDGGKVPDVPKGKLLPSTRVTLPAPRYCHHCGNALASGHQPECVVFALTPKTAYTQTQ